MNVSIGKRWEDFVQMAVQSGRYASSSEVIREGLRLVEEREASLVALKADMNAAIKRGGDNSDDDMGVAIESALALASRSSGN
ncbi:MAG TPA: type II toxin-antitoxin system ParD family antitoxin [Rhizobiaceae bacterium]|nr:type II toxin-antitoxin system ParD family antitoxin [Rhizobiaceae bacterium]